LAIIVSLQEIKIRLPVGGTTGFDTSVAALAAVDVTTGTAAAANADVAKKRLRLVVVQLAMMGLVESGPNDMKTHPNGAGQWAGIKGGLIRRAATSL
jgi:hypothetical protein